VTGTVTVDRAAAATRGPAVTRPPVTRSAAALAFASALAAASPAAAHEVLHDVERGQAIALKAYFADGEVLAYCAYEVYSPADPSIPWQKGRTDRAGWLAFRPAVRGAWRVKVVDSTGHGLDLAVPVDLAPAASSPAGASVGTAAFVLRPLLGVLIIAAIFAGLFVAYRRRRRT